MRKGSWFHGCNDCRVISQFNLNVIVSMYEGSC